MTRSTARRFIRQYSWARSSWRTWAMSSISSIRSSTIGRSPEIECGHRPDCMPAPSRAELLDLIDKHHDRNAFDRAKTLAWVQASVLARSKALRSWCLSMRSSSSARDGAGMQSGLWPHSISGDLPIVLLRIDEIDDMAQVRQLLRAHEYWRMKRLAVDLVIVNERASSYVQDLQVAIDTAVRSSWRT